jgi:6-phosphogluconolactonase
MRRLIRVLPDQTSLAAAAAEAFAAAASASDGAFRVALSGGNTPKALYALLAAEPLRARVPWSRVEVFFGDERCVPPDHPDSNFRMAEEVLLSRVPLEPSRIHRVRTELAPEEAARRYSDELRGPRFDWIFLGLGPDGHTASLFPGSAAVNELKVRATSVWVEEKKSHRVTITRPVIDAAKKVVFVVAGADKAEMVRRVVEEPADPAFPASLVAPTGGDLIWLLDAAAASLLKPGQSS